MPPVSVTPFAVSPPHTIIRLPVGKLVATATWCERPSGAPTVDVGDHLVGHTPAVHAPKQACPHARQSVGDDWRATQRPAPPLGSAQNVSAGAASPWLGHTHCPREHTVTPPQSSAVTHCSHLPEAPSHTGFG